MARKVVIERIGGISSDGRSIIYAKDTPDVLQIAVPKFPVGTAIKQDKAGNWRAVITKSIPENEARRLKIAEDFYYLTRNFLPYRAYSYVVTTFPETCLEKFEKNPFFLTQITYPGGSNVCSIPEVDSGIILNTFAKRVQEMAYIIKHVLDNNENEGNTWMPYDELSAKVKFQLAKDKHPLLNGSVSAYLKYHSNYFYFQDGKVANRATYEKEFSLFQTIMYAKGLTSPYPLFEHIWDDDFAEEQNNACQNLITKGGHLSILTGGPGTGKTTILVRLVDELMEQYPDAQIHLLASTGKASRRIKEVFGDRNIQIGTAHRFLGYGRRLSKIERDEIQAANIVIVDESSMLDLDIFFKLMTTLNMSKTKVILVGDVDQLPSVGAGNILADLIALGVHTEYLKANFRSNGSINKNAYRINNGDISLEEDEHFQIKVIPEILMDTFISRENHTDIVLTPYRVETKLMSAERLNKTIQKRMYGDYANGFQIGESVIMVKTNYKQGYFNGETGNIISKLPDGTHIVSLGDRTITVRNTDDMALGHVITMHKSQGSEYPYGIICIPPYEKFITRRMLYTAVTRAKENVILYVTKKEDIRKVILNNMDCLRRTFLSSFAKKG